MRFMSSGLLWIQHVIDSSALVPHESVASREAVGVYGYLRQFQLYINRCDCMNSTEMRRVVYFPEREPLCSSVVSKREDGMTHVSLL